MSNTKNNFRLTYIFVCLMLSSTVEAQVVRSLGAETSGDNGAYLQVSVQCATSNKVMFLRKLADSREWCDQQFGEFCDKTKIVVAQKMCGRKYSALVKKKLATGLSKQSSFEKSDVIATSGPINIADDQAKKTLRHRDSLIQERFEIEQKLINIETLRLDLRRREIDLVKSLAPLARSPD